MNPMTSAHSESKPMPALTTQMANLSLYTPQPIAMPPFPVYGWNPPPLPFAQAMPFRSPPYVNVFAPVPFEHRVHLQTHPAQQQYRHSASHFLRKPQEPV